MSKDQVMKDVPETGVPLAPPRPQGEGNQHPPTVGSGDTLKKGFRGPRKRRPADALLKDEATRSKISWSKDAKPDSLLADLISEGQVECDGIVSTFTAWDKEGRPLCSTCRKKHPGACLMYEEDEARRLMPKLLHSYKDEQRKLISVPAVNPPPAASAAEAPTSAARAPAEAQLAEAEAVEPAPKGKGKRSFCARCKGFHPGVCNKPLCEKCGEAHYPQQKCKPSEAQLDLFGAFLRNVTDKKAAEAAGKLFTQEFGDSSASSSKKKGKGKKRKAPDEGDAAKGKKKQR